MAQTRRRYTREFKIEAVRLLETSGKSASQIERELGNQDAVASYSLVLKNNYPDSEEARQLRKWERYER